MGPVTVVEKSCAGAGSTKLLSHRDSLWGAIAARFEGAVMRFERRN
jgi:hypothetical protein